MWMLANLWKCFGGSGCFEGAGAPEGAQRKWDSSRECSRVWSMCCINRKNDVLPWEQVSLSTVGPQLEALPRAAHLASQRLAGAIAINAVQSTMLR